MEEKKLSWKQLPDGDVLQAGTSKNFKTHLFFFITLPTESNSGRR
ncbi:MAG TPA: hypothetical protein PKX05_04650 [bacterium]|nr:hypothetical protein [bacterium]